MISNGAVRGRRMSSDVHQSEIPVSSDCEVEVGGIGVPAAPQDWNAVREWRKRAREQLIQRRLATPSHIRRAQGERAKQRLTANVDLSRYRTLGLYFPIRGEIDVRDLARKHVECGGRVALPVVVTRNAAVEFWNWTPGERLQPGLWNIPVPRTREQVMPDALIIPLVGFDLAGFRLGYGGGYYDRTLAAATHRPLRIGIGYNDARLRTIYPQAHDIPMDVIVTDAVFMRTAAEGSGASV